MGVLSTSTSCIITFSDDCHNDNTDDDDDIDLKFHIFDFSNSAKRF